MGKLGLIFVFAAATVTTAGVACAQQPASSAADPQSLGQVAGTVTCHDSGKPGRFASVVLLPEKAPAATPADSLDLRNPDLSNLTVKQLATEVSAQLGAALRGSNLDTLTELDGGFTLDKVPAGTYYVIAQLDSYRSPLNTLSTRERLKPDAATLANIESKAQKIVVKPGETTRVQIDLDRGATLGGTITYADGTAALLTELRLLRREPDGKWTEIAPIEPTRPTTTDDHGNFHFYGLPAGQYAVKAPLPTSRSIINPGLGRVFLHNGSSDELVVYSGGAVRESDIRPITLQDGESRTDIAVVFPLTGLHAVSGNVVAQSDHHAINTGIVELQDPQTKTAIRSILLGRDGTFSMRYVPDGAYLLKVKNAADLPNGADMFTCPLQCKGVKDYVSGAVPVEVRGGDVSKLTLQLAEGTADSAGGD